MTYGVTWATNDHSVSQTGYVYETVRAAEAAARMGPKNAALSTQVDAMCEHDTHNGEIVFGLVQTEDDNIAEVEVV